MTELTFSYNWNNKLNCRSFTSIRLSERSKVGDEYKIVLKNKTETIYKGAAKIIDIKLFYLDNLNEFIAHIDTGYSAAECRKIIERMYSTADWGKQKLSLILFKYVG